MSVVEVDNLRKVFVRGFFRRRTTAVDGVSFKVKAGEVFGFLGPNGAGKTTVMKCLMGLLHPTEGRMTVLGAPAGDIRAKRRVGYLPENPYFYDYLSAMEFMHMVGRIYGLGRAERARRAHDLLDRLGLSMAKTRPMRSYSKGMMQRVGLAQALVGDPDLVVMDEPMSGLDPIGRKEVRDLITGLRNAGKTVFFCTHILADANLLCDRVGIIVKGTLRDVGPLGELLSPQIHHVDVLWSGSPDLRDRLVAEFDDDDHQTTSEGELSRCGADRVDGFLQGVLEGGGEVREVTRHRETLEELFVRDAGEEAEGMRS